MREYFDIIDNAKSRGWCKSTSDVYLEIHHILPKCLGGNDESENLVALTAKEHYMAHYYLTKMHPDNDKICYAFHLMNSCGDRQQRVILPDLYEKNKIKMAKFVSNRLKGKKQSKDHIEKRSKSRWSTQESRDKQSKVAIESVKKRSPEFMARLTERMKTNNPIHGINISGFYNSCFKRFYMTPVGISANNKMLGKMLGCSNITVVNRCMTKKKGYRTIDKEQIIYYGES